MDILTEDCNANRKATCSLTHDALVARLTKRRGRKVCDSTAQRQIYALRDLGIVEYTPRRVRGRYDKNLPNLYRLPHLEGFFEATPGTAKRARKVSMDADRLKRITLISNGQAKDVNPPTPKGAVGLPINAACQSVVDQPQKAEPVKSDMHLAFEAKLLPIGRRGVTAPNVKNSTLARSEPF